MSKIKPALLLLWQKLGNDNNIIVLTYPAHFDQNLTSELLQRYNI